MGANAALQLREAVDRAEQVLAIEALCAAQGLDFRAPLRPGAGVARRTPSFASAFATSTPTARRHQTSPPCEGLLHDGALLATGATQIAHA